MAVIITIMAFSVGAPGGSTFDAVRKWLPGLLVYMLSFAVIGIYWNNHHHLLRATHRISAAVMWSNLHLLFWLSLIPEMTDWVRHHAHSHLPASGYGLVALGAAIGYTILVRAIIRANGEDSEVAQAIGSDFKGYASLFLYASGAGLAWLTPWIAYALYVTVALIWFIPDRRLARPAAL
jgi:uncharacterized membrane protein